ncbi:MAG TPA: hypothetical protein PKM73_11870 [Verrucomicrobiota bacterium]|nr:hypothetical protein [Verrucomicrobiota bacterium]HNU50047.1 hypothetical protein [Verrucomicrobiota bacterium]
MKRRFMRASVAWASHATCWREFFNAKGRLNADPLRYHVLGLSSRWQTFALHWSGEDPARLDGLERAPVA